MNTNKITQQSLEEMCAQLEPAGRAPFPMNSDLTEEEALWFALYKLACEFYETDVQLTPQHGGVNETRVELFKRNLWEIITSQQEGVFDAVQIASGYIARILSRSPLTNSWTGGKTQSLSPGKER